MSDDDKISYKDRAFLYPYLVDQNPIGWGSHDMEEKNISKKWDVDISINDSRWNDDHLHIRLRNCDGQEADFVLPRYIVDKMFFEDSTGKEEDAKNFVVKTMEEHTDFYPSVLLGLVEDDLDFCDTVKLANENLIKEFMEHKKDFRK